MKHQTGFTLIEVLVAMAIIAVSLISASSIALKMTSNSQDFKLKLAADWVAQNKLEKHSSYGEWLAVGVSTGQETQAGIKLLWKEEITATPNPAFRKVIVNVYKPEDSTYSLRRLVGFLVRPQLP